MTTSHSLKEQKIFDVKQSWLYYFAAWWSFVFIFPIFMIAIATRTTRLTLYKNRLVLRTGFLSKNIREINCSDIRVIDTRQNVFERIGGIGSLCVGTAGTGGYEFTVLGLKNPIALKQMVMEQKNLATAPPPASAFSRESTTSPI